MVSRTRRQSTVPDSPSRVTRSQLRRQSSNSSLPSPPKSATTSRMSLRKSLSRDSVQLEKAVAKPPQRSTRRSTRSSFTESTEDGPGSTQEGKLESIVEIVKPSPRRTRASTRSVAKTSIESDTDTEMKLPPTTRRTRQNSGSSIASASSYASPQRRTRSSRRNLSPVQSSFSDTNSLLEIPEASPKTKKTPSPVKGGGSDVLLKGETPTITPPSSKASSVISSSGKSPANRSSLQEQSSPVLKRHSTSFMVQEQGQNDSDSCRSRRVSPDKQETSISLMTEERRRSKGRLSLSSRRSSLKLPQFIETPFEDTKQNNEKPSETASSNNSFEEPSEEVGRAQEMKLRKSGERFSLSSNKSLAEPSRKSIPESSPTKSIETLMSRYSTRSSQSPVQPQSGAFSPTEQRRSSVSPIKSNIISLSGEQKEGNSGDGEASSKEMGQDSEEEVVECESSDEESENESVASLVQKAMSTKECVNPEVVDCESSFGDSEVMEVVKSPVKMRKTSEGSQGDKVAEFGSPQKVLPEPEVNISDSDEVVECESSLRASPKHNRVDIEDASITGGKHTPVVAAFNNKRVSFEGALTEDRAVSEEQKLTPIKQQNSVESDHLPATPSQESPVPNEMEISSSVKKLFSPRSRLSKGCISPGSSTTREEEQSVSSERSSSDEVPKTSPDLEADLNSKSQQSPDQIPSRVYKDAAILLNGGTVSDFEEPDSDDNQWQLVFSPINKSKKEQRMEKKAKRKEEKELMKKAKLERAQKYSQNLKKKNESKSSVQSKLVLNEIDKLSPPSANKENNLSHLTEEVDNLDDSSNSLPVGADYCSQILENFKIDVSSISNKIAESDDFLSIKEHTLKKRKGVCEEFTASHSEEGSIKKKKKKTKALAGDVTDSSDKDLLKKISKKKKKKMQMMTDEKAYTQDVHDVFNDGSGPHEDQEAKKKKKRKAQSLIAEECSEDFDAEKKAGKKSKKRKGEPVDSESIDEVPKKKKQKNQKDSALSSDSIPVSNEFGENPDGNNLEKKKLKKKKKQLLELSHVEDLLVDPSRKKKKKKKSKEDDTNLSMKMETADGSDSDDAPEAVSFAEGKQEALAELQAAAENIKIQKERKKQKLRQKLERIREQKLAKVGILTTPSSSTH